MQNCIEDDMVVGEIGKIYRNLIETLRKNMKLKGKVKILLKMVIFKDFPPIFCLTCNDSP